MFLENGYSTTSIKAIANALDMSTGHLTFYFPTKEHLLAELVDMLCSFQWIQVRQYVDEGESLLMAICLEFTAMAAICEENEVAKDFYLSAYTHPMTLEIIRKNDAQRAKLVFGEYCPDWTQTQYTEAETLISGIEYATMMTTAESAPIDVRIAGALNNIMLIYQVPEDVRERKIRRVLDMEYAVIGQQMLEEFIAYIDETNEQAFEDLLNR
jgi:transcriptional regulator, TetR family